MQVIACVEGSATIVNNFLNKEAYKKNLRKNIADILTESIIEKPPVC